MPGESMPGESITLESPWLISRALDVCTLDPTRQPLAALDPTRARCPTRHAYATLTRSPSTSARPAPDPRSASRIASRLWLP
jgi:hypothetical protein